MSIEPALAGLRERNAAPASFEAFAGDCEALARRDPLNAGFYVMLGLLARALNEKAEGRPLTAADALEAKARLVAQAERVAPALGLGPEAKLALLNDLAHAFACGH